MQAALPLPTLARPRAGAAADLGLVFGLWDGATDPGTPLPASLNGAIRRAAAAADRVGRALSADLGGRGLGGYRMVNPITPRTRIRRCPDRFWLEFGVTDDPASWRTRAAAFCALGADGALVGVRMPAEAAAAHHLVGTHKAALKPYRRPAGHDPAEWHLARSAAPRTTERQSTDLNDWLATRARRRAADALPLAACRRRDRAVAADIGQLSADLAEAVDRFGFLLSG